MKSLALLSLILCLAACMGDDEPEETPAPKLGFDELFAEDIDAALASIEEVSEAGRFEVVEPLLEVCRTHPSERVRQAAGEALETVCSASFGFAEASERLRRQAHGRALQWWGENRASLLLKVLVDTCRPQLSMEEDFAASDAAVLYLRTGLAPEELPPSLAAVEWLRIQSRGLESSLAPLLSKEDLPPRMKERVALAIGEGMGAQHAKDVETLVRGCPDILMRCALHALWARIDRQGAVAAMREALAAEDSGTREDLLRCAWGFDTEGVERHFRSRLDQGEMESWEIILIGQMGLDVFRQDIIRWAVSREWDEGEEWVFRDTAASLGLSAMSSLVLKELGSDPTPQALRVAAAVSDGMEEEDLIVLLKDGRIDVRKMAAEALGRRGSKSAVPRLMEALVQPDMNAAALAALEAVCGRDFSKVDPGELEAFLRHEPGDPAVLRLKFMKNRAQLWWSEHADLTRSQWLKMALNEAGFNILRQDRHEMSERETSLLDRLIEAAPHEAPAIFRTLLETGQDRNAAYVAKVVTARRSPSWADALMPWVDRPLEASSKSVALAFCTASGPQHHRQNHALLRSQHPDVARAAAAALVRWGGFRAVDSLIESVEYGTEEQALLAQDALAGLSGLPAQPILGLTKPQRKSAVKRWQTWWRSVADDGAPGAWQRKEVEQLLGEMVGGVPHQRLWSRLHQITGLPVQGATRDEWRKRWEKVSHPLWTLHGRDIVRLASDNFHLHLMARESLLSGASRDDVRQMAAMAAGAHGAFHAVLRRLAGMEPPPGTSWAALAALPDFPARVFLSPAP